VARSQYTVPTKVCDTIKAITLCFIYMFHPHANANVMKDLYLTRTTGMARRATVLPDSSSRPSQCVGPACVLEVLLRDKLRDLARAGQVLCMEDMVLERSLPIQLTDHG
jgi:hypothetical protein